MVLSKTLCFPAHQKTAIYRQNNTYSSCISTLGACQLPCPPWEQQSHIGASPSSGSSIPSRLRHGAGTEHFQAHLTPLDEMLRFQHPRPKKKKLSPATPSSSVAIFEVHRLNCRRLQTHLLSFCSAIWHLCIRRRLHICQMGKNIFSCNSCRNGEGGEYKKK